MRSTENAGNMVAWILRTGAAMCFIGHGAFGIIGKEAWLAYFGVVGISPELGWQLEPIVGTVDITMGVLILLRPRPAVLLWMAVWAIWTALLRPLSGESAWEAVERAGNYGVPIAMLIAATRADGAWSWMKEVRLDPLAPRIVTRLRLVLTATTSLLLLGHGMLAVLGKPGLVRHFSHLAGASASRATFGAGVVDLTLALLVAVVPIPIVAVIAALWKLACESLFVVDGAPFWEVVERGGSYTAPLALALLLVARRRARTTSRAAAS